MTDPTLLGIVESATGSSVTVGLRDETLSGLVYIRGQGHRIGQVGSFVRIPQGYSSLYGLVTQAGVAAAPPRSDESENPRRWLTVEIVGEGQAGGVFGRGVFRYPTIGDEVHLVVESDLETIYGTPSSREYVEIGRLSSAVSIPARINVNRLVTRHSAIVGSTGSGKSTTVASLVKMLSASDRFPAARIVILDIHGEYASAFRDSGRIFRVGSNPEEHELCIPYWALTFDELQPMTLGPMDDNTRGRVIDWITSEKRRVVQAGDYGSVNCDMVTVDTAVPFSLRKLWHAFRREIDATYPRGSSQLPGEAIEEDPGNAEHLIPARFREYDGQNAVQSRSTLAIRKQLDSLQSRLKDPRFNFLFAPGDWHPDVDGNVGMDLDTLLAGWLGDGGASSRPVSILDLSGVPESVLQDLVGSLLRILFDSLFWGRQLAEGGRERPLLIVMEEAHAYASAPGSSASKSLRRIVREGRKYGVGAMIVSQRPSEIDASILSQCGTIFALRVGNAHDQSQVSGVTSEGLRGLLNLLPTLRTGEAIVVGEAVHIPTRTLINLPPQNERPNSDDPRVVEMEFAPGEPGPGGWDRNLERSDYSDLVAAWRRQNPSSTYEVD